MADTTNPNPADPGGNGNQGAATAPAETGAPPVDSGGVQKPSSLSPLATLILDDAAQATLAGRGFTSPAEIAGVSRAAFLRSTRDVLGEDTADQIYSAARAQSAILDNVLTDLRVRQANGLTLPADLGTNGSLAAPNAPAQPGDCNTATGPLAYLTDLLTYTLKQLKWRAPGLTGRYYQGTSFNTLKLTRVDPTVNFDWGTTGPDPSIGTTNFSVRWTGQIVPQYTETYTFYTLSDDGIQFTIDGQLLINNWTVHAPTENSGTISLEAGRPYTMVLAYYQAAGGATAKLEWASDHQSRQVIPSDRLYTEPQDVDLQFLARTLFRSFEDLPPRCDVASSAVHQVRLCVEVLRRYLAANPPATDQQRALAAAEQQYRFAAYSMLLAKHGTSFDDLRLSRTASDRRQKIADRLGIDPTGPGADGKPSSADHLAELLLDPNATTGPQALTEAALEQLFGLADTTRDGFSQGSTIGDDPARPFMARWWLQGVDPGRNTDPEGKVYLKIQPNLPNGPVQVDLYRGADTSDRTKLVATGAFNTLGGFAVAAMNDSGLSGSIVPARAATAADANAHIALAAAPALLTWQLTHLRAAWHDEDWPQPPQPRTVPIVDPDVVSADYLAQPASANPAYPLWQKRVQLISQQRAAIVGAAQKIADAGQRFTTLVSTYLGVTPDTLDSAKLDATAISYLKHINEVIHAKGVVLGAEWEDVYDILTQGWKLAQFPGSTGWLAEEQGQSIAITPEFFILPDTATGDNAAPTPTAPLQWRASFDLGAWVATLQTRTDQQRASADRITTVAGEVEVSTLPSLRDALVTATGSPGTQRLQQANWLANRLLVDAAMSGDAQTTRAGQMIETLQGLLFAARTGQLSDTLPPMLLESDNFDDDWRWLGSYDMWRAAMRVFLYPDTVLLPSLRPDDRQTPQFGSLVNSVIAKSTLTRDDAAALATDYLTYFNTVAGDLYPEATCQIWTRVSAGGDETNRTDQNIVLVHLFARGLLGNKLGVWWSTYDPAAARTGSGFAQSFWQPLPGLDQVSVNKIVGAVPTWSDGRSYIYLFLRTTAAGVNKLQSLRFAADVGDVTGWDALQDLSVTLPQSATYTSYDAVVAQPYWQTDWPHLILATDQGHLYHNYLKPDESGWQTSTWQTMEADLNVAGRRGRLLGAVGLRIGQFCTFYDFPTIGFSGRHDITFNLADSFGATVKPKQPYSFALEADWQGALHLPTADSQGSLYQGRDFVYVFYRSYQNSNLFYTVYDFSDASDPHQTTTQTAAFGATDRGAVGPIVVSCADAGQTLTGATIVYLQQSAPNDSYGREQWNVADLTRGANDTVAESRRQPAAPVPVPPVIPNLGFDPSDTVAALRGPDRIKDAYAHYTQQAYQLNQNVASNLTYVQEAFYFVPLQLALALQRAHQYTDALDWYRVIYDYGRPKPQRLIYYGLIAEQSEPESYLRGAEWLRDPINPHAIAQTRPGAYTRFTLISIVQCLLDDADDQFAQNTSDALAEARTLYLTALNLLSGDELGKGGPCVVDIGPIESAIRSSLGAQAPELVPKVAELARLGELARAGAQLRDVGRLRVSLDAVLRTLATDEPWGTRLDKAFAIAGPAVDRVGTSEAGRSLGALLATGRAATADVHARLLGSIALLHDSPDGGSQASTQASANGKPDNGHALLNQAAPEAAIAAVPPIVSTTASVPYYPSVSTTFSLEPNPLPVLLRQRAESNLSKLRSGRNIAGLLQPGGVVDQWANAGDDGTIATVDGNGQIVVSSATLPLPTNYRYQTLVDRAKQLAQLAGQFESAMLSAKEKYDAGAYDQLRARQDADTARASVRLKALQVTEAQDGATLANSQQQRAAIQRDHYQYLIDAGETDDEKQALDLLKASYYAQAGMSLGSFVIGIVGAFVGNAEAASQLGSAPGEATSAASVGASYYSMRASYERRQQEWEFQLDLATQDVLIGQEQVTIATDQQSIAQQDQTIAQLQSDHAAAIARFLQKKFTNADLYAWMSDVLAGVYRFFLQEATATAQLAAAQLAFERQEPLMPYIRTDYWDVATEGTLVVTSSPTNDGNTVDRQGLTGSARLLQDIYQLDDYAFRTNQRKLQLTKTISLALQDPFAFQRFVETGILPFTTTQELFDRDFPGHYLRLIHRVRVSVVALVPPIDGIHAILSTIGFSRVVTGPGPVFQSREVRRDPERIALSSSINATGVFDLDPQSDLLLPFEGIGVEANWLFELPRASNRFDFSTIADVLVTIDYTALSDGGYYDQVVARLNADRSFSADRAYSFRQDFPDQWYALNNLDPHSTDTSFTLSFRTVSEDFPPNIDQPTIQQVLLYFSRAPGKAFEMTVNSLGYTPELGSGSGTEISSDATTSVDGRISTRATSKSDGAAWRVVSGKSVTGTWKLEFPDDAVRAHFGNDGTEGDVQDLLLVITYLGTTPAWPQS